MYGDVTSQSWDVFLFRFTMIRQLLLLGVICSSAFALHDHLCCTLEDRHEIIHLWGEIWSAEHSDRLRAVVETTFARYLYCWSPTLLHFITLNVF